MTRDGVVSNQLDPSRIKVTPTETESDRAIYEPSVAARTVLEDVQVGDTVEVAFTIEGGNPMKRGKYCNIYLMQWETLIVHNIFQLVYPATRKLRFKADNGA